MRLYSELMSQPDESLIKEYDRLAPMTTLGVGFIRDELHRREMKRNGDTMLKLTWILLILTIVNLVLVAVSIWPK